MLSLDGRGQRIHSAIELVASVEWEAGIMSCRLSGIRAVTLLMTVGVLILSGCGRGLAESPDGRSVESNGSSGGDTSDLDLVTEFIQSQAEEEGVTGWSVGTHANGIVVYVPDDADDLADRVARRFPEVTIERGPPIRVVGG